MHKKPITQAAIPENGTGPATRKSPRERAVKLAGTEGAFAQDGLKSDWEQAKGEFGAKPRPDPKEAVLEALPESQRWNPLPGSAGHQTPETASEDEDDEGRSEAEQLFDDGVEAAERDQARQAGRAVPDTERLGP